MICTGLGAHGSVLLGSLSGNPLSAGRLVGAALVIAGVAVLRAGGVVGVGCQAHPAGRGRRCVGAATGRCWRPEGRELVR